MNTRIKWNFILALFLLSSITVLYQNKQTKRKVKTKTIIVEDPLARFYKEKKIIYSEISPTKFHDLYLNKSQNRLFGKYKSALIADEEIIDLPNEQRTNLRKKKYTILEYTKIGN